MLDVPNIASLFGALFGNKADQATIGRATNQVLLILLGAGLCIVGVIFVVSGSKSGQVIVQGAKAVTQIAGE